MMSSFPQIQLNLSKQSNQATAKTNIEVAYQRAENLAALGVSNVLELCVGPSLQTLKQAYSHYNIKVIGNDIDPRWQKYYPQGKWLVGDALKVPYDNFGAVVFAPPLSLDCSGARKDALSIDQVRPSYRQFLNKAKELRVPLVLVLPARSWATTQDRKQYFHLLSDISSLGFSYEAIPLKAGRRNIRKYVDLYLRKNDEA